MKKIVKWVVRILIGLLLFCLLLSPFLFTRIDRTPYREMPYYKEMVQQLDTFQLEAAPGSETVKIGWSKRNITPSAYPDLAGYGLREKANCLHDSVFVRAFAFDDGKNKSVFVSIDLLIFPPVLEERLRQSAGKMGYSPSHIYLSATHTHSAPGGWAEGAAGRVLAGTYKDEYVDQLLQATTEAIRLAEANKEEATIGFGTFNADAYVRNRLNMPDNTTDPWIRVLKVKKKSGAQAALVVYSAHANCLKMKYTCLSGDYPAEMIMRLEKSGKIDFAMYAAGMVGSHIPMVMHDEKGEMTNEAYISAYGDSMSSIIQRGFDSIPMEPVRQVQTAVLDLPLREPHLKISENWRVRPWLFNWFFGPYDPKLKILKLNQIVFIGTPCDFSGELMEDLEPICKEKNLKLVVTSFNGGYIGYVNVDRYYDKDKAETRDMNWFGPYNQAYFTEILQRILKKI